MFHYLHLMETLLHENILLIGEKNTFVIFKTSLHLTSKKSVMTSQGPTHTLIWRCAFILNNKCNCQVCIHIKPQS